MADNKHMGTIRMTASGKDQLSYLSGQRQKHKQDAKPKDENRRVTSGNLLIGQLGPLE
jgi:hypothetical protein